MKYALCSTCDAPTDRKHRASDCIAVLKRKLKTARVAYQIKLGDLLRRNEAQAAAMLDAEAERDAALRELHERYGFPSRFIHPVGAQL
mgnify:CR=1 FL=1